MTKKVFNSLTLEMVKLLYYMLKYDVFKAE